MKLVSLVSLGFILVACSSAGGASPNGDGGTSGTPSAGGFGVSCKADTDCTGGRICVFSTTRGGVGFCSSACDKVADCPMQYDCQFIGNAARKYCVPEDHLADCKAECELYSFQKCFTDTGLASCNAACDKATVDARKSFGSCPALECTPDCVVALDPNGKSWLAPPPDPCMRANQHDIECKGMQLPPNGYECPPGDQPKQTGCMSLPFPGVYCCPM